VGGEELEELLRVTSRLEKGLMTLERRGINLPAFLGLWGERGLPSYRVLVGGQERWCYTWEEVQAQRPAAPAPQETNGSGHAPVTFVEQELHEVRDINRGLQELARFGLVPRDLVPQPRIAGREPPVRLKLESGEQARILLDLRDLMNEIRRLGEKGMSVTRFKGLGEMDPDELWATTLDPDRRTLMRVQLDDALKADEMFRTLMGEKVEPRRNFIQKYAQEVKDIDLHGA
jgi:DNA gyrase subunit B